MIEVPTLTLVQRMQLTASVPVFGQKKPRQVLFYRPGPTGGYLVPRFFRGVVAPPVERQPMAATAEFKGRLFQTAARPQVAAATAVLAALRQKGGALLVMPCGSGKTNTAISIAHSYGQTCAVLCHKVMLLDQWVERLREFSPTTRVGRVHRDVNTAAGADVTVVSIQSLLSRDDYDLPPFGLVIVDECHHIAAATFSSVLTKLTYGCSLGLSATPERKDGLAYMVELLLGPEAFRHTAARNPKIQVNLVAFPGPPQRNPNLARAITALTENSRRNTLLLKIIRIMLHRYPDRKGLVLSGRVAHLHRLRAQLPPATAAVVIGKTKDKSFTKQLTLSTYHLFAEAIDFDGTWVLFATPRSSVEQAAGRVMRGRGQDAIILDVVDGGGGILAGLRRKREGYYRRSGFVVQTLRADDVLNFALDEEKYSHS